MLRRIQLGTKYVADRLIALISLVVLSPVLILIAIAVKLDDGGPILFSQKRAGLKEKPFDIWKFRTMIIDADKYLDASGMPTKDRVTRVGKFLRRTSMDELPQLFNILIADMSLVGPRPVLPEHIQRYSKEQRGRFIMRPGLTGLAQVSGRNMLKWSNRLEFDVQYVDQFSLFLDMKIIFKTFIMLFTRVDYSLDQNPQAVNDLPTRADKPK